ncbi:MAG: hypothetical protein SGILL_007494, partial [Bacillariaceae sp.]
MSVPVPDKLIDLLHEEHTIRSILFTDDSCRVMNKNFYNFDFDLSKNKSVKELRNEKQKQVSDRASKLIAKQYRQVSIQLHPDHHGEKFRKEFDALQVAYEILKESESRGEYMDSMVAVIEKCRKAKMGDSEDNGGSQDTPKNGGGGTTSKDASLNTGNLLQMANTSFISDYMKKKETKDSNWRRYKEKTGKKSKNLYLEASIFSQPPKSLRMVTTGGTARKRLNGTVVRTVRLPPLSQSTGPRFQELCRTISIYTESQAPDGSDILLLKMTSDELKAAFDEDDSGWITADIKLPDFGTWNVYWLATLEDASNGNTLTETPKSSPTHICCETSRAFDARKRLPGLVTEAKKMYGSLGSICRQWDNFNDSVVVTSSSVKLEAQEQKLSHLASQLNKASDLTHRLYITLEDMGWSREEAFSRQKELHELVRCVAEADLVKSKASAHVERSRKRQGMKSFRSLVADLIENKDLNSWIKSVTQEEITASGGDLNRLYQILMEGKSVNFLDIERMSSLWTASNRIDLFSEKQSKSLLGRAMDMNQSLQLDLPQMAGLNKKSKKDESEEILPLETAVILIGLKQRADLNGKEAKYMGIGGHGRFNILVDGSLYALKLENFIVTTATLHAAGGAVESKPKSQEEWQDCAPKVVQKKTKAKTASAATKTKASNYVPPGRDSSHKPRAAIGKVNKSHKEIVMWLPKEVYPRFIGRNAKNIHDMGRSTRTRMWVDVNTKEKPGFVALKIEGSDYTIGIAQENVKVFLEKVGPLYVKKKETNALPPKPTIVHETEQTKVSGKKGAHKTVEHIPDRPPKPSKIVNVATKKIASTTIAKKPKVPTAGESDASPIRSLPSSGGVASAAKVDAAVVTPSKEGTKKVEQPGSSPPGTGNILTSKINSGANAAE